MASTRGFGAKLLSLIGMGGALSVRQEAPPKPKAQPSVMKDEPPVIASRGITREQMRKILTRLTMENVEHFCSHFPCKACGRTRPRKMVRRVRWQEKFVRSDSYSKSKAAGRG